VRSRIVFLTFILLIFGAITVYSLPQVDEVIQGNVKVKTPNASTLKIKSNSNKAIINYSSFDIQENEKVIMKMPSSKAQVLNRVVGKDSSDILGSLSSNGLFILVNERGIYIGPNARIDASSLILSTRDINNNDFMSDNYVFKRLSNDALDRLLRNDGLINIQDGGFGVLIAGAIENKGAIVAKVGKIVLASGDAVKLELSADGLISVAIEEAVASTIVDFEGNPVTDQIKNTGTIQADGSTVILNAKSLPDIFEKTINLEGVVRAVKVDNRDGIVQILSPSDVTINALLDATEIEIGKAGKAIPENVTIIGGSMHMVITRVNFLN